MRVTPGVLNAVVNSLKRPLGFNVQPKRLKRTQVPIANCACAVMHWHPLAYTRALSCTFYSRPDLTHAPIPSPAPKAGKAAMRAENIDKKRRDPLQKAESSCVRACLPHIFYVPPGCASCRRPRGGASARRKCRGTSTSRSAEATLDLDRPQHTPPAARADVV